MCSLVVGLLLSAFVVCAAQDTLYSFGDLTCEKSLQPLMEKLQGGEPISLTSLIYKPTKGLSQLEQCPNGFALITVSAASPAPPIFLFLWHCGSSTCSSSDYENLINSSVVQIETSFSNLVGSNATGTLSFNAYMFDNRSVSIDWTTILSVLFFIGLLLGAVAAVAARILRKVMYIDRSNSLWSNILSCFDPVSNFHRWMPTRTSGDQILHNFSFVRVLMLLWVILGHEYLASSPLVENFGDIPEVVRASTMSWVYGADFGVDVFFFLSGFFSRVGDRKTLSWTSCYRERFCNNNYSSSAPTNSILPSGDTSLVESFSNCNKR
eukprot:TRINITY_DN5165_c0_g2_i1.p1 TRINITY_DN5165_c0_g2~~TRINITY_DN5165_c0_g2_i1.p1  ORF type:complete len:323 (-),score=15.22 TRINITY_DN5165_c0_g2_i1:32-1000(-)